MLGPPMLRRWPSVLGGDWLLDVIPFSVLDFSDRDTVA